MGKKKKEKNNVIGLPARKNPHQLLANLVREEAHDYEFAIVVAKHKGGKDEWSVWATDTAPADLSFVALQVQDLALRAMAGEIIAEET